MHPFSSAPVLPPLSGELYDAAIIGAGITGCAAAFELSRTTARIALLDRDGDVAAGATWANSASSTRDTTPSRYQNGPLQRGGQRPSSINTPGSSTSPSARSVRWCSPCRRTTSPPLRTLYERGKGERRAGLALLSAEETRTMEPALAGGTGARCSPPRPG